MNDGMSEPPLSVKTGSSLTESVPDKVVLVGDVGVGKTSLFLRFKTGQFQQTTPSHNPRDGECQKEWTLGTTKVSVSNRSLSVVHAARRQHASALLFLCYIIYTSLFRLYLHHAPFTLEVNFTAYPICIYRKLKQLA